MMADSGYKLFTDFWNSLDAGNKRPMTFDTFDTFLHSNPVNLHLGYLSGISMATRAVRGREDLCLADLRDLCPLLLSNCKGWGCYLHTAFEQPLRETDTSSSSRTQDSFISGDLPVERPPTGTVCVRRLERGLQWHGGPKRRTSPRVSEDTSTTTRETPLPIHVQVGLLSSLGTRKTDQTHQRTPISPMD